MRLAGKVVRNGRSSYGLEKSTGIRKGGGSCRIALLGSTKRGSCAWDEKVFENLGRCALVQHTRILQKPGLVTRILHSYPKYWLAIRELPGEVNPAL